MLPSQLIMIRPKPMASLSECRVLGSKRLDLNMERLSLFLERITLGASGVTLRAQFRICTCQIRILVGQPSALVIQRRLFPLQHLRNLTHQAVHDWNHGLTAVLGVGVMTTSVEMLGKVLGLVALLVGITCSVRREIRESRAHR